MLRNVVNSLVDFAGVFCWENLGKWFTHIINSKKNQINQI